MTGGLLAKALENISWILKLPETDIYIIEYQASTVGLGF